MKAFALPLFLLCALPAWAQPAAAQWGRPGQDGREDGERSRGPARAAAYTVDYVPTRDGSTSMEVLEPAGAQVSVWDEGSVVRGLAPMFFSARPDRS